MPSSRTGRQMRALARALLQPVRRRKRRTGAAKVVRAPKRTLPRLPARPAAPATTRKSKRTGTWLPATYRGPAGSRSYFVYVPAGVRRNSRLPVVVALHGCTQNAAEFATTTRFNELADKHGFIVVYPEQTPWNHQHRCWHWYERAHQQRDTGEPAIIVGITAQVAAGSTGWRVDPARVYVTGLSAGGAMALVLAATYPDVYAAVGIHSAPAYRSAAGGREAMGAMAGRTEVPPPDLGGGRSMPPTILFQGTADHTVHGGNGQRVADQWLAFCQARVTGPKDRDRITRSRTSQGRARDGRAYTTTRWYTARGRTMLEYWQVDGLGHAWSGGVDGHPYSDPKGPRASTAMWRFFAARKLVTPK